jgi:predicted nicotinamide N-methyase
VSLALSGRGVYPVSSLDDPQLTPRSDSTAAMNMIANVARISVSNVNDIGRIDQSRSAPTIDSTARRRLLHRIRRRFSVLTETVSVGLLTVPFTRIEDPNRVLDEVAAEEDRLEKVRGQRVPEDQLHLPYWAELWDSAMGIAQFIVKEPGPVAGLSVLDLGCGMGLAGAVAAALGHRVMFADLEAPALLFARLNSLPWAARVRARQLDWRKDKLRERFDLILGADILYERRQWDYLEPFWREHLAQNASILLGEPGRKSGDLFVDWIRARDWTLDEYEEPVETRTRPIRLFRLTAGG